MHRPFLVHLANSDVGVIFDMDDVVAIYIKESSPSNIIIGSNGGRVEAEYDVKETLEFFEKWFRDEGVWFQQKIHKSTLT